MCNLFIVKLLLLLASLSPLHADYNGEDKCLISINTATARIKKQNDEFCHTNPIDNGIALEKEFPHIAVVEGKIYKKIQYFSRSFNMLATDTKCAGALITNNIVLTSDSCVNSTKHAAASIKFGVLIFNDTKSLKSFEIRQNDMITQYHLTILKLPEELEINEFIAPAHMPNFVFDVLSGNILLAGWTGFKYECNQQLRKWFIPATKFWSCGDNLICLNQTDILNYREMLVAGTPLQIYHPLNNCQYTVVAIFKEIIDNRYKFIDISSRHVQIENQFH